MEFVFILDGLVVLLLAGFGFLRVGPGRRRFFFRKTALLFGIAPLASFLTGGLGLVGGFEPGVVGEMIHKVMDLVGRFCFWSILPFFMSSIAFLVLSVEIKAIPAGFEPATS